MLIVTNRPQAASVKRELHKALRACYTGLLTQEQLEATTGIPQATISRWVNDASTPDPYEIAAIEKACDEEAERRGDEVRRRPAGWVIRRAGLIAEVTTVPEAIGADRELNDDARAGLLRAYRGAVAKVRGLRTDDGGDDR